MMEDSKNYKNQHCSSDIRRAIVKILSKMQNPNVKNAFLSVVDVNLSKDLSYCKVYVSSLYGIKKCEAAVVSLNSSVGYIRCELAKSLEHLRFRVIPEILFVCDDSIEYGVNMSDKISQINNQTVDNDKTLPLNTSDDLKITEV